MRDVRIGNGDAVKRLVLAAFLACAPSFAVAGDASRLNSSTQPHVFRYADAEEPAGLNPVLVQQGSVNRLGQLAMAWLFRYGPDSKPAPELATVVPSKKNGGISPDGKTITYHLRTGVKWSDGRPFNADDVVFSFNAMNNPSNIITSREGFELIEKIDEPNAATVVVHLRRPYASFIPIFFTTAGGQPCLLPKHILGSLPNINTAPYNNLPIGIGPFRFTAWHRGEAVDLEANPNYWRGRPKLDRIVYKLIPDRNTVLTQLQTGELDFWYPFGGAYLSRVESIKTVDVVRKPGYLYNHLDFNLSKPVLQEKAVRQALRLASDRTAIRDKVLHGVGFLQESVVPAAYPGAAKLSFVKFDIAQANALLDRAGWKRASDGVREKNGLRLQLEFVSSTGTPDADTQIELIRATWQQIGVGLDVKRAPSSLLFAPATDGGIVNGGKFDVIIFAWGVSPTDDLYNTFSCDSIPPKGQNDLHYCNRALEPILADFQTRYNPAQQTADLNRAAHIIADDVPTIVLVSREDLYAANKDLKNFHPNNVTYFDDMMNVDI